MNTRNTALPDPKPKAQGPRPKAQKKAPGSRPHRVLLISPYDLGRQPHALAHPTAWLREAGFEVTSLDLSQGRLEPEVVAGVDLVAVHLGMHTATRIALEVVGRIREAAPEAVLCAYGLYAPMNEAMLRRVGFEAVLGGEYEPGLLALAERIRAGQRGPQREPVIALGRGVHRVPDRRGLSPLERYAHLKMPDGRCKRVGFVNASRGCKHLCRHCPVVPVYEGHFRIAPVEVVLADIHQQITEQGAEHISFGDPDFLNGPRHALRVVEALHASFPEVTWDAVIKIEHLLGHAELLPRLKALGCLFVTSAVESVDAHTLEAFDKGHTAADFARVSVLMREAGIALSPTFVPFTPWTRLESYAALLATIAELGLIEAVSPVQLTIRLLVPEGSYLLRLPGFEALIGDFDPVLLGYPWRNPDPEVDGLQRTLQERAASMEGERRGEVFAELWSLTHRAMGRGAPALPAGGGHGVPQMSEAWYCCAEPTSQQLTGL